jgi:hypothetical protein
MNRPAQSSITAVCGIGTSILAAALLSFIELRWGHALYSFTVWFVIPIGALGAGMVAAVGYLIGARLANYRPSASVLSVIVTTSAAMFFLIQWMEYSFMAVDGRSIQDSISFHDFLGYTVAHTSLRFGVRGHFTGPGIEIGTAGYLFAGVQVIGFVVGGLAVYGFISSMTYCDDCGLYLNTKGTQTRYFGSAEEMKAATANIQGEMQSRRLQHSVLIHGTCGAIDSKGAIFSSLMEVKSCKGCGKHWTKFTANRKSGNDWKEIPELSLSAFSIEPVELHETISGLK